MRQFILTLLLTSSVLAWADDVIVSSPDGQLQLTVSTDNGRAYYSASLQGLPMLEKSALGLKTSIGDFTKGLTLKGSQKDSVSNSYTMRGTKAS